MSFRDDSSCTYIRKFRAGVAQASRWAGASPATLRLTPRRNQRTGNEAGVVPTTVQLYLLQYPARLPCPEPGARWLRAVAERGAAGPRPSYAVTRPSCGQGEKGTVVRCLVPEPQPERSSVRAGTVGGRGLQMTRCHAQLNAADGASVTAHARPAEVRLFTHKAHHSSSAVSARSARRRLLKDRCACHQHAPWPPVRVAVCHAYGCTPTERWPCV